MLSCDVVLCVQIKQDQDSSSIYLCPGMAPRDIWDCNPIFTMAFDANYRDLIEGIGFETDVFHNVYEDEIPPLVAVDEEDLVPIDINNFDRYYERYYDGYYINWLGDWMNDSQEEEEGGMEVDISTAHDGVYNGIPVGMIRATPESSDWGSDEEFSCHETMDDIVSQ